MNDILSSYIIITIYFYSIYYGFFILIPKTLSLFNFLGCNIFRISLSWNYFVNILYEFLLYINFGLIYYYMLN